MRDGQSTRVSREDVLKELEGLFKRPIEPQVRESREMVNRLLPYVEQFYDGWQPEEGRPHYMFNGR